MRWIRITGFIEKTFHKIFEIVVIVLIIEVFLVQFVFLVLVYNTLDFSDGFSSSEVVCYVLLKVFDHFLCVLVNFLFSLSDQRDIIKTLMLEIFVIIDWPHFDVRQKVWKSLAINTSHQVIVTNPDFLETYGFTVGLGINQSTRFILF